MYCYQVVMDCKPEKSHQQLCTMYLLNISLHCKEIFSFFTSTLSHIIQLQSSSSAVVCDVINDFSTAKSVPFYVTFGVESVENMSHDSLSSTRLFCVGSFISSKLSCFHILKSI